MSTLKQNSFHVASVAAEDQTVFPGIADNIKSWFYDGIDPDMVEDDEDVDYEFPPVGTLSFLLTVTPELIKEIASLRGSNDYGNLTVNIVQTHDGQELCMHTFTGFISNSSSIGGILNDENELEWPITLTCNEVTLYAPC